jgi:hypothetical protein
MESKRATVSRNARVFVPSKLKGGDIPLRIILRTAVELASSESLIQEILEKDKDTILRGKHRYITHPSLYEAGKQLYSIWKEKYRFYDYDYFTYKIIKYILDNGIVPIKQPYLRIYLHPDIQFRDIDELTTWLKQFSELPSEEKIRYIGMYLNKEPDLEPWKVITRAEVFDTYLNIKEQLPFYLSRPKVIWGGVYEFVLDNLHNKTLKEVPS